MQKNPSIRDEKRISKAAVILCPAAGAARLVSEGRRLVLLIRHGQTDWNAERRLQGRESVPLNDAGREQSRACGELLRQACGTGLGVGRIFCSPLERAHETAEIIARALGIAGVTPVDDLIERDYGALSGLNPEERRRLYRNGPPSPDAEPVEDVAVRMKRALVTLTCEGEGTVVAVTHGGVTNALFYNITVGNVGTGKNCSENCGVSLVAVGHDATFPLAFGLTGEGFLDYIKEFENALK